MTTFQKAGNDSSSASILQMKAKDVVTSNEKLQKHKDELQSIVDDLTETMWESKTHELKGATPEEATTKIDEEVEMYVSKYRKIFKDNENIISNVIEKSVLIITPGVASSVGIEQNHNSRDKFKSMQDLCPRVLEKGTNVLEVQSWIIQVTNWIEAGFKDSPPQTGVYKYIMPLLHDSWIAAL